MHFLLFIDSPLVFIADGTVLHKENFHRVRTVQWAHPRFLTHPLFTLWPSVSLPCLPRQLHFCLYFQVIYTCMIWFSYGLRAKRSRQLYLLFWDWLTLLTMIISSYVYFLQWHNVIFYDLKKSIVCIYIFSICSLAMWLLNLAIVTNDEISIRVQGSRRSVDSGLLREHQHVELLGHVDRALGECVLADRSTAMSRSLCLRPMRMAAPSSNQAQGNGKDFPWSVCRSWQCVQWVLIAVLSSQMVIV